MKQNFFTLVFLSTIFNFLIGQVNLDISLQQRIQIKEADVLNHSIVNTNKTNNINSLPEQDCSAAIIVCQPVFSVSNSYSGVGNVSEIPSNNCLGAGEKNSVWYSLTTNSTGNIEFLITPNNLNDDYDFALYDVTTEGCSGINSGVLSPVRCNFSATGGTTGLSSAGSNASEPASGSNYSAVLFTQVTKTYVLVISNYSSSVFGYTLDFSASTAAIYTGTVATLQQVNTYCGTDSLLLNFSRPVVNASIAFDGSDFSLSGPGGPYMITSAQGFGNLNSSQVNIKFNPPMTGLGTWTLGVLVGGDNNTLLEGCSSMSTAISSMTFNTQPLTLVVGPTSVCKGSSFTLTASPATTYTWSGGLVPVAQINQSSISINTSTAGVFNFSVQTNGVCGMTSSTKTVSILDLPTADFSVLSANPICVGSSVSFSNTTIFPCSTAGNGSNICNCGTFLCSPTSNQTVFANYTWDYGDATTQVLGYSPVHTYTNSGSYVIQLRAAHLAVNSGCISTKTLAVNVLPSPALSVATGTLCVGSSLTLFASGADTYLWSNGETTPAIFITPTISETYTVTGTNQNICTSTETVSVIVDNTCQDVWPGDVNSDGLADNFDVLELGLHFAQTGAPRASISNAWQSYFSNNWTGTITNGKNLNHSDCNGDGTINDDDTLAIFNNYGLTHAFRVSDENMISPQLTIVPDQPILPKGTWGTSSIYLGDASNIINDINGVAFTVNFDNTIIEPNTVWLEYPASFINTANQNLHFRKSDFATGKIYTATTHTVNNNVSGNGLIGILHYQIKSSLTTDTVLNLGITQAVHSDVSGSIYPLTAGKSSVTILVTSVGLQETMNSNFISMVPNPTDGILTINSKAELQKIEVVAITGQVLRSETPSNVSHTLHLDNFANGIYFVNVYQNNRIVKREKVVLNK